MNRLSLKKSIASVKSIELAHLVYNLMDHFPQEERFGIGTQLRRSVLSIGANLTEGYARRKSKVFLNHLEIAYGSLSETKFFLYFSCERKFISQEEYMKCWKVMDELGAILYKSIISLELKINREE